jgi:hypothetical protein
MRFGSWNIPRANPDRRLALGTAQQLNHIEVSAFGVHWPDLDEDLSFHGLLNGDHGQFQKRVKA